MIGFGIATSRIATNRAALGAAGSRMLRAASQGNDAEVVLYVIKW